VARSPKTGSSVVPTHLADRPTLFPVAVASSPLRPSSSGPRPTRAASVASLLVLGVGLTALFLGYGWFWVVFAVGFAVVVPLVSVLAGEDDSENVDATPGRSPETSAADGSQSDVDVDSDADPLETLRRRYARGELTDAQFERKLEALLETETLEAVEERARRRAGDRNRDRAHDRGGDRDFTTDAGVGRDAARETE
jgi:hypothetical protein